MQIFARDPIWLTDRECPCDCPVAEDVEHTVHEHYSQSCGGQPCGGCYDCLCKQIAYNENLGKGQWANCANGSHDNCEGDMNCTCPCHIIYHDPPMPLTTHRCPS